MYVFEKRENYIFRSNFLYLHQLGQVRVAQSPLFLFTPTFAAIVLRLGDWAETAWIVISLLNSGDFLTKFTRDTQK